MNLPHINWDNNTVSNKCYPHTVSQTYLDITQELGLEQTVNFPTLQENTLDLVSISHPGYKIRCKLLPPIREKSDHDIVLYDKSHQVYHARPPCRKIFLWKKADLDGIKSSISVACSAFKNIEFDSIEGMWASLKTAVTTALEQHVLTKMSSTRRTPPWVNTNLRRMMRRKQRAHRKVSRSAQAKDWDRFKKLQPKVQRSTRLAHRSTWQMLSVVT